MFELPGQNILPPSFRFPEWCDNLELLHLYSSFKNIKSLKPLPSLKFLRAFLTSISTPIATLRDEVRWFVGTLPPTLEVLDVNFDWTVSEEERLRFPSEMLEELDELMAAIPIQCPKLKLLLVKLDRVSKLFRRTEYLTRLVEVCKMRSVPLVLHILEFERRHGFDDEEELNHIAGFENHLL